MAEIASYGLVDGIATLAMDDGKVNVLSPAMQEALHDGLDRAEADGAALLLTGRRGVFSAGFDLAVLRAGGTEAREMISGGFQLAARLLSFPAPVVIACGGHAIAMGVFLLLSGDYRIGAEGDFRIAVNEVAIGLTQPRASIEICRQRLTPAAFTRAVLLAETFTPADAVPAGFLDAVVPLDSLMERAQERARILAQLDRAAHTKSKGRARASMLDGLRAAIAADDAELRSPL